MKVMEICRHGKIVFRNGQDFYCGQCDIARNPVFGTDVFGHERFNAGLGRYTSSYHEEERIGKEKGLMCVAGAKPRELKKLWPDHPLAKKW